MWDNGCVNFINGECFHNVYVYQITMYTCNILQFLKFSLNEIFKNYFSSTINLKTHY